MTVNENTVFSVLKPRPRDCNKGDFGRLLNISGCDNYTGAPILSTVAAMRSGCGITVLASTRPVLSSIVTACIGTVTLPLPENDAGMISRAAFPLIKDALKKASACLIGCGLGLCEDTAAVVSETVISAKIPLIIDADGINALRGNIDILKKRAAPTVITPHLAEMSRLTDIPVAQIKENKASVASEFAKKYSCTVILKDSFSLVSSPSGEIYENSSGCPGLAKAGSGDVLAGIVAGFIAQGIDPPDAAVCGMFLHGKCGERAGEKHSQYGMLPSELPDELCEIFKEHSL